MMTKEDANGLVGLYGRDGRLLGKLCLDTDRAQIGNLFYVPERTCRKVKLKRTDPKLCAKACSECGKEFGIWWGVKYCPHCGARVVESEDK